MHVSRAEPCGDRLKHAAFISAAEIIIASKLTGPTMQRILKLAIYGRSAGERCESPSLELARRMDYFRHLEFS